MTNLPEGRPSGQPEQEPKIECYRMPLPSEMDSAWCDIFREAYGGGDTRISIHSERCFRQQLSASDDPQTSIKNYDSIHFTRLPNGEFPVIDGVVAGVKLIPDWTDDEGGLKYKPYAVIKQALLTVPPELIPDLLYEHPEQEFLVPLAHLDDELVLYSQ